MNDDVSFFVAATNGFKSGGWPARATANVAFIPFKPEKIWSHEVGMRCAVLRQHAAHERDGLLFRHRRHPDPGAHRLQRRADLDDDEPGGSEELAAWRSTPSGRRTNNFTMVAGLGNPERRVRQHRGRRARAGRGLPRNPAALYQGAPACNANFVDQFGNIATPVRAPDLTVSLSATYRPAARLGEACRRRSAGNYTDEYAIGTTGSPQSDQRHLVGTQGY